VAIVGGRCVPGGRQSLRTGGRSSGSGGASVHRQRTTVSSTESQARGARFRRTSFPATDRGKCHLAALSRVPPPAYCIWIFGIHSATIPHGKDRHFQVSDDLDGSAIASEFQFAFERSEYTIDVSSKNRKAFEKGLRPCIEAGTRVSGRRSGASRSARPKRARDFSADLAAVRAWAKENGHQASGPSQISMDAASGVLVAGRCVSRQRRAGFGAVVVEVAEAGSGGRRWSRSQRRQGPPAAPRSGCARAWTPLASSARSRTGSGTWKRAGQCS
jgi:hypothetical protein